MKVAIIGMGLMGGSLSLCLKKVGFASRVIGVENHHGHLQEAKDSGLADEFLRLEEAIPASELVILCTPVDSIADLLPRVLSLASNQVVMDIGSTKSGVSRTAEGHEHGRRFVPTHPMWGTEFSGPLAATDDAFTGKAAVICNRENIDSDAIELVESLYKALGMHILYMSAAEHDLHAAYVSHISHITSFALANTVLEKEKEGDKIFELASGGFESTVRLAKSNPDMWLPIFKENRDNVLDVLNEHIVQLRKFKACLEKNNFDYLEALMIEANKIKKILK